jgi:hypothetical protein
MKRWQALHTLAIVYRDAFNNQLNDRYRVKWNEYRDLARDARQETLRFGIGLVLSPIPMAPQPVFSFVAGPNPATTYYAQVTWVSTTGQEGNPSDLTTFATPTGSALVIGTTNPPSAATGFNVYLGLSPAVTLQNSAPIPAGQSFTIPPTGLVTGHAPGNGQTADLYIVGGRTLRRG